MSTLWRHAYDISLQPGVRTFAPPGDEYDLPGDEVHADHAMHPWLHQAGFDESPCGYLGCPKYDERHNDMMERAYSTPGVVETHEPGSIHLHGMEKHIDPAAVIKYMHGPSDHKAPPHVFTYGGQHHILDGHHRLLADAIAGRPMTFEHTYLEDQ